MKSLSSSCLFVLAGIFVGAPMASAQEFPLEKDHTFEVGLEGSYIKYREPDVDVQETGGMGGVYGIYDARPEGLRGGIIDVFHLDGHVNYANMKYEGSGTIDNIDDIMFEPRAWVGRDFPLGETARVTPYVGIGYRMLFDALGGKTSSTGASGYDRLSQYIYAPVGFEISTDAVTGWRLGATAEYDIFIHGWQKSYLSEFAGFPDITNNQEKGWGARGALHIIKKMDRINLSVSPYVRYWHIEDSDVATATGSLFQVSGYEPENTSIEYGLRVGLQF